MWKYLALTLTEGLTISLPLSLLLLAYRREGRGDLAKATRLGVMAAAPASLAAAAALGWLGGREYFELVARGLAFLAGACWGAGFLSSRRFSRPLAFLLAFFLTLLPGLELALSPGRIYVPGAASLNTDWLLALAAGLSGLGLAILSGLATFRAGARLEGGPWPARLAAAAVLVLAARQLKVAVQMLFVVGFLPLSNLALSVLVPLINRDAWFFAALPVLAGLLILLSALGGPAGQGSGEAGNPAEGRKLRARAAGERRAVRLATGALALSSVLLLWNSYSAGRGAELSPAMPVAAAAGEVRISLEGVSDSRLHRFGYTTADGTLVRFLVIRRGGNSFGVALDACAICGPAGYYQRGGSVVCLNCDVVISIPTIGLGGGCNPIPLKSRVEGGEILVAAEELERAAEKFR